MSPVLAHKFLAALSCALLLGAAACGPAAAPAAPTAAPTAAAAKPAASPAAAAPAASPKPAASPAAAAPAASPSPAAAAKPSFNEAAVTDFYRGKTVRIVVGFSPGGGFDTYARAISRYLGKYIPGNPTVIVENMPGAGSMLSANSVYNTLPKDGTTIAHFIGGVILQQFLGNPGAQFDSMKLQYIGAPTPDTGVCVVRKDTGVTSLAQLRGRSEEMIMAGTAPGSNTDDIPLILKQSLGLNIKLVQGYPGTADMRLAIDKKEADGGCWGWESLRTTYSEALAAGEVIPIGQAGEQPHPELPNVPMFRDVATSDEQRQIVRFGIDAPAVFNRPYVVAPEVPADRVAALRQAFARTLADKDFLEDATKSKLAISPISGERVEQLVKELFGMPAPVKQQLVAVMNPPKP